jgi:chemotaxis protein CheZ
MAESRRPFRVETLERGGPRVETADRGSVANHLDRISAELSDLRTIIHELAVRESDRDRQHGGMAMWTGVGAIHEAIVRTRSEISALSSSGPRGHSLYRATDELDAVVSDTESATETILAAAETIDASAGQLVTQLSGEQRDVVMGIHREAIRIFEACNFQDISGQRISKVVSLLRFIELRVASMVDIWGAPEKTETDGAPEARLDATLLNGPALAGDADVVSQDDIDSLFA